MTDQVRNTSAFHRRHGQRYALLSALLLVASCNTLKEPAQKAAPASPAPKAAETTQSTTPTAAPTVTAQKDSGINRNGRVLQLGRLAERGPGGQPPQNNVVSLNFEQEDFRTVIEQLGDALGISMVIDPTIDYKVSLRTSANNPLRYQDIWPLLRLLARNAGVTIEQAGNVFRFSRNASNVPAEIVQPSTLRQSTASEVLQVTPLTYISVKTLEPILQPLLQPAGSIIHMGEPNLLGIMGTPEQLSRINSLLSVIDDDPFQNQGIQLYQLRNSPANKVSEELTNVLKLIEGEQSSYHVLGLERINSVLVVAPATRGFTEVDRWVNILDAESQEQSAQLFVYKVKNLVAKDLAESLTNAFTDKKNQNNQNQNNQNQPAVGFQQLLRNQLQPNNANNPNNPNNQNQAQGQAPNQTVAPNPTIQTIFGPAAVTANNGGDSGTSANLNVGIVADEKSNSLLVRATPREYRQLLSTINTLDAVPLQVLINAVIGQVTLTEGTQFGVDWTRVASNARISSQFLPNSVTPVTTTSTSTTGAGTTTTTSGTLNSLFSDSKTLPQIASGFVMAKTFNSGGSEITAALQALSQDNKVKLLARPTILAANNQEGKIHVGESVPVNNGSTVSTIGTTSNITYKDVGIELTITPQINHEGYINLKIDQKLSSVEAATTAVGNNPSFSSQELSTQVVVSDQSTITLGGLIQEDRSDNKSGIPLLQDIPVLGRAFSYNQLSSSRKELFVILQPQIVYGDARDAATIAALREKFTEVDKLLQKAGL